MGHQRRRRIVISIIGIFGCTAITTLFTCYAQNSQSIDVAMKQWQSDNKVEISEGVQLEIARKVRETTTKATSHISRRTISDAEYTKAVSATTYVVLSSALKAQVDARGGGSPSKVSRLEIASVAEVDASKAAGFLSDANGFGWLTVASNPTQAEIYVDGQFAGYTKTELGLTVGHHVYEVKFTANHVSPNCRGDLDVERARSYQKSCPQ